MHGCGSAPTQPAAQWQPVPFIGKVIRRSADYATSSGDSGAAAQRARKDSAFRCIYLHSADTQAALVAPRVEPERSSRSALPF